MKNFTDLLGRALIAFLFLYEAYDSIAFFKPTLVKMTSYGMRWQPEFLLNAAIVLLVLGGLMVLLGYRASLGAFLLLLYWIPVTFIVHDFWNVPYDCKMELCDRYAAEGQDIYRRLQGVLFMKNLAITGGLLMILVNGSGRFGIRRLFATTRVPGA